MHSDSHEIISGISALEERAHIFCITDFSMDCQVESGWPFVAMAPPIELSDVSFDDAESSSACETIICDAIMTSQSNAFFFRPMKISAHSASNRSVLQLQHNRQYLWFQPVRNGAEN